MAFHPRVFGLTLLLLCSFAASLSAQCVTDETGSLTYNGEAFSDRPVTFYTPGEQVEICFSLDNQFQTPDAEWIHGVFIVEVGPGLDFNSMQGSFSPDACSNGTWKYYDFWERCHTNCSEPTFRNGFGFDGPAGAGDCNPPGGQDGDPGNNFGDLGGQCGLVFCWTFDATDPGPAQAIEAYSISVRITADGISGSYRSSDGPCRSPCSEDPNICFPEIEEPDVMVLNSPCPGELFELQGFPVIPGVNAEWVDGSGTVRATGYNVMLPEGSYTLRLSKPNCSPATFEIDVELEIPILEYTGPDDGSFFCFGDDFDLSIIVENAEVNFINWILNGEVRGTGDVYSVIAATPDDGGEYTILVNYGDGCDTSIMVNILVGQNPVPLITSDPANAMVCEEGAISFFAVREDGTPFPEDWVLTWDSPAGGGDGPNITIDQAFGTGLQIMNLEIIDEDGCITNHEYEFTINEVPTAIIDPDIVNICRGDIYTIVPELFADNAPLSFRWSPENIVTTLEYVIEPPYDRTIFGLELEITDANGCVGFSNLVDVFLNDSPQQPTLSCDPICTSDLGFSWESRFADYYAIYATTNFGTEVLIDGNYTETSYVFTGLDPDTYVAFRVVPFSGDLTSGCAGPEEILGCSTPLTWTPGFQIEHDPVICADGTNDLRVITGARIPGSFTFTSADLGLTEIAADASDTTVLTVPALPDGVTSDTADITISYLNALGGCPSDTVIRVALRAPPNPSFMLDRTESLCGTPAVFTATPAGNGGLPGQVEYSMSVVDPATGSEVDPSVGMSEENGDGTFTITIFEPGTYELVLVCEYPAGPRCGSTSRQTVTVAVPPPPPLLECSATGLDFVTFTWSDEGHDVYEINEIDLPAGAVLDRSGNTVTVTGLNVNDAVTLSVTGLFADCTPVFSNEETCVAQSCPDIVLEIAPIADVCVNGGDQIEIVFAANGSDGTGTADIFLDGVITNGSVAASSLSVGPHTVRVNFMEGCDYFATRSFEVRPFPLSDFTLPAGPICTNAPVTGAAAGAAQVGYTYAFTTDNSATVTPGADASERTFSYASPGTYEVTLVVTNEFGCVSEPTTRSVEVVAPLADPVVTCDTVAMEFVVFAWEDQVGVDSFGLSVNGGPVFYQDSTTFFAGGLGVDSTVTLVVTAVSQTPCAPLPSGSASCTSVPCPSLVVNRPPDRTICADYPAENLTLLTTTVSGDNGGGSFTFSGPGVVFDGTDYLFDASVAGLGSHELRVDFTEGQCFGTQRFVYTVVERPVGELLINGTAGPVELCVNSPFTLSYAGNVTAADNAGFRYFFVGQNPQAASGSLLDTLGFQEYTTGFPATGDFEILLVIDGENCPSDTIRIAGTIVAPPAAPVLRCGPRGLNEVTFEWDPVAGATGYTVVAADGTETTTAQTSVTYTGLTTDTAVSISVYALTDNVCGPGPASAVFTCRTLACPDLAIDLSGAPSQICLLEGDEFYALTDLFVTGGSPSGTLTFSGDGVLRDTFFAGAVAADETGEVYTISVDYQEAGPCTLNTSLDITVFARPTAFLTNPGPQCTGDTARITIGSTNFVPNDNIMRDWDGGTVIPDGNPDDATFLISWSTPGAKNIRATVISNISGCPSEEALTTVVVSEPLAQPAVECSDPQLESVTLDWGAVAGATGYRITTVPGGVSLVDAATTTLTVNNLFPGQTVGYTIQATGDAPCGDGPLVSGSCTALACPGGVVMAVTAVSEICLDGTESAIPLEATLTDGMPDGTITWTGTGVVSNADGTHTFDPTGLPAGAYELTVNYDGPANCDSEATITITLYDQPEVTFNPTPTQLCVGEEFTLVFTGTAANGATYQWDYDGAVVTDLGNESYALRWDTPGQKTVRLTVTDNCVNEASFSLDVTPTLDAPVPNCTRQDLDGVLFTWPAVAAATEGYRVSINGGPYGTVQTATEFFAANLAFGEEVTINVLSVRSGTNCDQSAPSATVSCAARVCPTISFAPAAAQTSFCSADASDRTELSANLTGDDGSGVTEWSGSGVIFADGSWFFDPVVAGTGEHSLRVTYVQEGLCTYEDELTMTVTATPDITLRASTDLTCIGSEIEITVTDNAAGGSAPAYDFDFGGATVTPVSATRYRLAYGRAGSYDISVRAERAGCTRTASVTVSVEAPVSAGTPVADVAELCEGAAEPLDLADRLRDATPGGRWSAPAGTIPNGTLDPGTGVLSPATLNPGSYVFTYEVSGAVCPAVRSEVLVIILGAPVADAGPDQLLTCRMGMVTLNGTGSETGTGYTYAWTSPDPDVVIANADQLMVDVGQPGVYELRVTNAIGCSSVSQVTVNADTEAPVMELELSQVTCFQSDNGAIAVTSVSGGLPPYSYAVNGVDRGRSTLFTNLAPASYDVQVTDANGCFSNIVIDITQPDELTVSLRFPGDSTEVNAGDNVFITASVRGGNTVDTLLWQPDSLASMEGRDGISFVADETRMISVTVVDDLGCSATDRQLLLVRRDRPVFFPTAFSPNGDNNNDIYFINGDADEVVAIRDFFIYNRWGELLYQAPQQAAVGTSRDGQPVEGFLPNDPAFGWDGTLNGKALNPQVCVYTATVEFSDGEVVVYKGDFVIMR